MILFPKPVKKKKVSKQQKWYKVMHEEIVPQFEKWDIKYCEINFSEVCRIYTYLGFAHTKKRRNISNDEDLRRVVLACQPCHEIVEYNCINRTGKKMTDYLEDIIKKRENKLKKKGLL